MSVQAYTGLSAEQKTFYDRALLERLTPNLLFAKYGQKKSAPAHEGDTVQFRRFAALSAATTALTEGTTAAAGSSLSVATVSATVAQYGDYVEISDKLDLVGIDPVLTETAQVLGEQAALTIDTIVKNVVTAGTAVQYSGSGNTARDDLAAGDNLTVADIKKAVRTLRGKNAKPFEDGFYIGIIHPDVAYDLAGDSDWKAAYQYQNNAPLLTGEIGKIHGVRFVESTAAPKVANTGSVNCYLTMIFGRDAYGIVDVEGSSHPEMILHPAGSSGSSDPLDQRATCGWKAMFAAVRLDENAMVRLESTASA